MVSIGPAINVDAIDDASKPDAAAAGKREGCRLGGCEGTGCSLPGDSDCRLKGDRA